MSQIVEKVQKASVKTLSTMVQEIMTDVEHYVVDKIGEFLALRNQRDDVLMSFVASMNQYFDELLDKEVFREEAVFDYESLSLVQEEDLETMMALEGMVNYSRNEHLSHFIGFNTRLNSLFSGKHIDETSSPLDPEQVAHAFQEALRPIGMDAKNSLVVYRAFNKGVLRKLDQVLQEANKILIDDGVIPDLGMESAKKKARPAVRSNRRRRPSNTFGTVEEEDFDENLDRPELFSMMQNLLHGDSQATTGPANLNDSDSSTPVTAPAAAVELPEVPVPVPADQVQQFMVPAALVSADAQDGAPGKVMQPFQPAPGQQVQMVDQADLMQILNNIQQSLDIKASADDAVPKVMEDIDRIDISKSLGESLNSDKEEGVINAVDQHSSDVINLVTLLYEAIWQDETVPIPIKELIGRTQITIIKVALADTTFFDRESHPARALLNEFAAAGIGWTEVDELGEDPLYKKIRELVEKMLREYVDDISVFEVLLNDFRRFKKREAAKIRHLEQSILKADERKERLDDIRELVTQKIEERVLGRELHPFVADLLEKPFHKFMVMLILKEGPGTNAWKQSINTIDVLLWSVQPHEQSGDRTRLETVNPRLLNNLKKAFRIATLKKDEINSLITRLKEIQEESFGEAKTIEPAIEEEDLVLPLDEAHSMQPDASPEEEAGTKAAVADQADEADKKTPAAEEAKVVSEEASYGPFLEQVKGMTVGIWVEFVGQDGLNTRCKLAAKINAIDKFIFVNREGVKVVEKTTIGLARELQEGTVRIISDGLLFSRALESVIGNLRDSQLEQQSGGAYRPHA